MDNKYYVYYLIDPLSNTVFYVGKGYDNRMYDHERFVLNGKIPHNNKHLFYKIKNILNSGRKIVYNKILDGVDETTALLKEIEEIKKIGRSDLKAGPLCNLTCGGDGISGFKMPKKTVESMKNRVKLWYKNPHNRNLVSKTTKLGMIKSGYIDRISKTISLKNPLGNIITCKNICKFCRDNNLINANVYKLLHSKIKTYKGWSLP